MEHKQMHFKVDKIDEVEGIFEGYGSIFGNVDSGGDVVDKGAFEKTLKANSGRIKILALHNDSLLPIGVPLEIKEDDRGLYLKAKISRTSLGQDVKVLLRDGVLNELSIGYDPVKAEYDSEGNRHLKEVDLWEVSVVTWAMNPKATISGFKSKTGSSEKSGQHKNTGVHKNLLYNRRKDSMKARTKKSAINAAENEVNAPQSGQKELIGLIEEALELVEENHKSRKEAGEETGEITAQEILEAVEELTSGEEKEDGSEEEEAKAEEPEDECKGDEEAEGEAALTGKSRTIGRRLKNKIPTPTQRKYSAIYLPTRGEQMQTEKQKKQAPPAIQLARAVKCFDVHGRHDPEAAAYYAKKLYDDGDMAREFKTLNATSPSGGGYLIPEIYLDQIIEMLYAKTVVFELGAQKVPMANGNLNIPKQTAGARATWGGEQRKISKTQTAFGNIKLSAKRLQAIVPQTRELLLSTSYSADQIFANDLTRRMELGIDFGALYGSGGEFEPAGIRHAKGIEHLDAKKLDNLDFADVNGKITADFPVFISAKVLEKNVDDQHLGWAFNSALEGYFKNMKTTTGAYIYREEMNTGKLLGLPVQGEQPDYNRCQRLYRAVFWQLV